jgi:hypothetical protein
MYFGSELCFEQNVESARRPQLFHSIRQLDTNAA